MNSRGYESLAVAHGGGVRILADRARQAASGAYVPYSNFPVGAAVLTHSGTFSAANVENASYGLTLCAERAAIAKARSEHVTPSATTETVTASTPQALPPFELLAVAVACTSASPDQDQSELLPCGACRQWMAEFGSPQLVVIICKLEEEEILYTLSDLLPNPFLLPSRRGV